MKRIILLLISILLISNNVIAYEQYQHESDGYWYVIEDGYAVIIGYEGEDTELQIPSTVDGYPVIEIGGAGGIDKKDITSLTIAEGIKYIGEKQFQGCINLKKVVFPSTLERIGTDAFQNCESLTTVTIPENVTWMGAGVFHSCGGLTTVNINSKIIAGMEFQDCVSLENVNIGDNVESIGMYAFSRCYSLKRVVIPENVKNMSFNVFDSCDNLTDIILVNENVEFVEETEPGGAHMGRTPTFIGCHNLSSIYAFRDSQGHSFAEKNSINYKALARVILNGEMLKFDVPPVIENDRVMVPMRKIFEVLGAEVSWDDNTSTATAFGNEQILSFRIGNNEINVNGVPRMIDTAPQILFDRTLVPVRAMCEALNATVEWDDANQTVIINTLAS